MKRIRIMLCMLFTVSMCFLCSCGFFGNRQYVCEVNDVQSIQIVSLDKYIEGEYRYEYTVLCEIDDHAKFVEQLNDLKHSVNWGEPGQLDEGYVVIRIDYLNGDYDLLYPNAQWMNRSGENQYGYFFFDEEQFDALISKYLSE